MKIVNNIVMPSIERKFMTWENHYCSALFELSEKIYLNEFEIIMHSTLKCKTVQIQRIIFSANSSQKSISLGYNAPRWKLINFYTRMGYFSIGT